MMIYPSLTELTKCHYTSVFSMVQVMLGMLLLHTCPQRLKILQRREPPVYLAGPTKSAAFLHVHTNDLSLKLPKLKINMTLSM
jgi:hypothetical protein